LAKNSLLDSKRRRAVYESTPEDTGCLFRSPEELDERLRALIHDGPRRARLAANAFAWVAQDRLLAHHFRRRYDWYLHLRSTHCLAFFGTPLGIEPSAGKFWGDAGMFPPSPIRPTLRFNRRGAAAAGCAAAGT
jgi:hypothetical protein